MDAAAARTLRAEQERLLAESLPRFEIAPDDARLRRRLCSRVAPRELWLEIGFGAGEHLIEQASAHPDVGFIGCEPFLNGVAAALAGIEREGLANVRVRRGDVQTLLEAAPDAIASRASSSSIPTLGRSGATTSAASSRRR